MKILTLFIIGTLVVSVWYAVTQGGGFLTANEVIQEQNFVGNTEELPNKGKAPDLQGITGWLNTEPLTPADLQGKVVLIDFWTYSCINCIRTLPYLQQWHETYKDSGFILLGVHTPEFAFEKERENVAEAIQKYGLEYPVAQDNNYETWRAFENQFWPAHYLLDVQGNIRFTHFGEGKYAETESAIQQLLLEAGLLSVDTIVEITEPPSRAGFSNIGTPEIYLGASRINNIGNVVDNVRINEPYQFVGTATPEFNRFYLDGLWTITPEAAELEEGKGSITLQYKASKAHMVLSGKDQRIVVEVKLDGEYLTKDNKGEDVVIENGKSFMEIKEARLYNLVDTKGKYDIHTVELLVPTPGLKAFTYTFG